MCFEHSVHTRVRVRCGRFERTIGRLMPLCNHITTFTNDYDWVWGRSWLCLPSQYIVYHCDILYSPYHLKLSHQHPTTSSTIARRRTSPCRHHRQRRSGGQLVPEFPLPNDSEKDRLQQELEPHGDMLRKAQRFAKTVPSSTEEMPYSDLFGASWERGHISPVQ